MDFEKIKNMVEDGFANKRISKILQISEKEIKNIINSNNWKIINENFKEDKIDRIIDLYKQGVSAKNLGLKFSIDKRRIQKWVNEKNLLRDKGNSHRFTEFNQNIFDVIDSDEKAYWLGFFYADAYNCDITNTFSLTIKDEDYNHLIKLCNFINLDPIKINKYLSCIGNKKYPTCSVKMYSKHLCQKMTELGCPRAKSFIIKYPNWLNEKFNTSFIRGMFDGDGCICKRLNDEWKWSIATTKECGESIQNIILKELSIIVNLTYISKTNNNTYELEANGNEKVLKLTKWLYDPSSENTRLNRKYEKMLQLIDQQNNRSFSRSEYKISEEESFKIINESINGEKNVAIAKQHNVHPRTVSKIIKNNKLLFDKIVVIDGHQITAKYVKTLDYEQRMELVEPLFQYFRKQGWIYPDNISKINQNYKKLVDCKVDLNSNDLFNNNSLATDICKYFCHKFYEATEYNKPTMIQVFNDDNKLKKLIKNRLGFDWWEKEDNDETFNITFRMLIQGMRSSRLVPSISIFKPNIAKYLCMKYSNENDIVYDYSAGWGGRLLGTASCNRKYIGVDPLTTSELQNMVNYLSLQNITLIDSGSENVRLEENSIDFSFSSPPYFDQEVYCIDKTQAYNNGEDYFYNIYWKNTLENIKYMLKPNKWFGLNVKNYPKMLEMAINIFGEHLELVNLRTIRNHLTKSAGVEKNEYVYMFKNIK